MIEGQQEELEGSARLSGARAEFVASLGRRLEALRAALGALEREPRARARRDNLLRRVHALGAGARVLGFASVAEALGTAEAALQRSAGGREVHGADLAEVSRAIDLLPTLVWGNSASIRPPAPHAEPDFAEEGGWPISVLVFGAPALAEGLADDFGGAPVEAEQTDDFERARELCRTIGPDVIVVDADRRGARDLAEVALGDPLAEPAPIVVVGTFDTPESAASLVALGAARVLPKPVSPDTLRRTVIEVSRLASALRAGGEPIGDVNVDVLAERIAAEVRRGLVEAVESGGRDTSVPLGEGSDVLAAVWGAVARVRELVTMRSGGSVRFDPSGPEGAIPLVPWIGGERRAGGRGERGERDAEGVPLQGRRIVIADDDPAVVWFLAGLVRAAGAEPLEAHDGQRALEIAFAQWPDLVVSDVLMPGLDGFALCREIKRDVAIRDVPVILLSWKEDLLQRVRELGADADGYLRKEAAASTVVARLQEVLRPRARVEARLSIGGEVRGRLDGLTPRLVLELACARQPNSRISVRDAAFLYEVQIREGRPHCATRTASDGGFQRGPGVLAGLLGVSAGRFVLTPDTSSCRRDFDGSLADVLKSPIAHARAAQRALSAENLMQVESVGIDEPAVAAYLAATPDPARSLAQRLIGGASPRDLVQSSDVSPRLLEAVLSDLARHAGVMSAIGTDGSDLIALALEKAVTLAPRPVPEPPSFSPPPQFTLELSPGVVETAPSIDAPAVTPRGLAPFHAPTPEPPRADVPVVASAVPAAVAITTPIPSLSTRLPLSSDMTPFLRAPGSSSHPPAGFASTEHGTLPGMGAAATMAVVIGEQSSVASLSASRPAAPVAPDEHDALLDALGEDWSPPAQAPVAVPPAVRKPAIELPRESPSADSERGAPAAVVAAEPAEPKPAEPKPAEPSTIAATQRLVRHEPPPAETKVSEPKPTDGGGALDKTLALGASKKPPEFGKTLRLEPGASVDSAVRGMPLESAEPRAPVAKAPGFGMTQPLVPSPSPSAQIFPLADPSDPPPPAAKSEARAEPKTKKIQFPRDAGSGAKTVREDVKLGRAAAALANDLKSSKATQDFAGAKKAAKAPSEKNPVSTRVLEPAKAASGLSGFRMVLVTIGAALLSFLAVRWVVMSRAPEGLAPPAARSSEVPVSQISPAPAPRAARTAAAPSVEDLELPPGVPLSGEKGLLEVDTGGKHAIYVDGTFLGPGPTRRIPLDPGSHVVKAQSDDETFSHSVEVRKSRRTRLSFPSP